MNILFVSSQFPNCAEPERGVFSLQIARELARLAQVQVVAPVPTLGPLRFVDRFKRYRAHLEIPAQETIDGLTVYHPKYFALPGMGFSHARALRHPLRSLIAELNSRWPIDAVNCHWVFPDGVAAQGICRELGLPLMLTPLGTDLNKFLDYRLRRQQIVNALCRCDRVSVLSSPMRQRCLDLGVEPGRLQLIPNGVDLEKFTLQERAACRSALQLPEGGRVILFVGSLVPVKGIDPLLRAFASLRRRPGNDDVRLYLIGGGFLEQELKRLACQLEIAPHTSFLGRLPHGQLCTWMNGADCLCLPSLSEGHPNVVMEALACGLPVVASAVGAIPDYVTAHTGELVTPADPADLADKLERCLATPYRRESIRATVAQLSWGSCAASYYGALAGLARGVAC